MSDEKTRPRFTQFLISFFLVVTLTMVTCWEAGVPNGYDNSGGVWPFVSQGRE